MSLFKRFSERPMLPFVGRAVAGLLAAFIMSGCPHGCAGFGGDVEGTTFDPAGTTFSYVDAFDDTLASDPRPAVAIASTWLIFDPEADLSTVGGDELEAMRHELTLRDAMSIVFADQADIVAGETFDYARDGNDIDVRDGMEVRLHFAPEVLTAQSTYSSFAPLGSRREVRVSIDSAEFTPGFGAGISAQVTIDIERGEDDPADARIGRFEGGLSAPLVEERAAERNLGLLDAEPLLGLPRTRAVAEEAR